MFGCDRSLAESLDRHITGNYGDGQQMGAVERCPSCGRWVEDADDEQADCICGWSGPVEELVDSATADQNARDAAAERAYDERAERDL